MLTLLRIKNLALVADLTVEFEAGYNVITGETGAGKSILIGALNLVLGERADRTLIRGGSDSCSVEAIVRMNKLKIPIAQLLEENGLEPCEDGQLVLKRTLTSAGANRQFVNGSPTSLNVLAAIGELLVDIHGPHDHQSLLHPARQLAILDAFANVEKERDAFAELAGRRAALEKAKGELVIDDQTYARQRDLLRFQVEEINAARLQPEEEEQVQQDYHRSSNAAKLLQLSQAAVDLLSEQETSLQVQAGVVGRTLQELERLDKQAAELVALHGQAVSALNELQTRLSHYSDKIDIDPKRLQELEERINLIQGLKRKYGGSIPAVLKFGAEAGEKLRNLEGRDAELQKINAELTKLDAELWRTGQALSNRRKKAIPQLNKSVSEQLSELGFKQSRLDAVLTTLTHVEFLEQVSHLAREGLDRAEFQFAPNPGEPMRPLRAIASSGELARVMLALKTVLATEDLVPVLIFDEVDANVGGETAHAVGRKMRQISENRQVLCITHLAQVAAPANSHYVAVKQTKAGRTTSEILLLGKEDRVTELARMLGGQTDAARRHAEALLK